jgi:hypothetical protein
MKRRTKTITASNGRPKKKLMTIKKANNTPNKRMRVRDIPLFSAPNDATKRLNAEKVYIF